MALEDYYAWDLGDDYDCDDCGWTDNQLSLEFWEDGVWQFYIRVGCYDGKAVMSDDSDFRSIAEQLIEDASGYPYFGKKEEREVRKILAQIWKVK